MIYFSQELVKSSNLNTWLLHPFIKIIMRFTRSSNNIINGSLMWGLIILCLILYPLSLIPAVIGWLLAGTTFVNMNNGCDWHPAIYFVDLSGWAIESVKVLLFLEDSNHV